MTVAASVNRVSYSGNGSTTAFAFAYPFRATSDLVVTVRTTSTGAESLQTEGTHYTVTGTPTSDAGGYASGTVTFVTAPASGTQVHIDREPARTQTTDYIAGDGIPPSSIEGSLDRLTLLVQDLESRLGRTLMQPRTAANRSLSLPEPSAATANQVLSVSAGGNAYTLASVTGIGGFPSVMDYGAAGNGTTNDTSAFQTAEDLGRTVYVPGNTYAMSTAVTTDGGAWFIDPRAKFASPNNFDMLRGAFQTSTPAWTLGSNVWRLTDRVFIGAAANSDAGHTQNASTQTFISGTGLSSFYLERSATTLSVSPWGGIGLTAASRSSDRYAYLGYGVWTASEVVAAGAKRGRGGRLYTTAAGGTCGSTGPSHTTGSSSDGGVTWTFVDHSHQVPIGMAAATVHDVSDGDGAWAGYFEIVRASGSGTCFAQEIAVKNKGSDVSPDPYQVLAGGSTHGLWFAGGGDATLGAPANPSATAISVGKNATTWNRGIVFASDSLTLDGSSRAYAINMGQGHMLAWWRAAGSLGARIWSSVSTASTDVAIEFADSTVKFLGTGGNIIGQVEAVASAANYLRLISQTTGNTPELRAGGSDTNVDLALTPKGTGNLKFGTHTASGDAAVSGYITIKDAGGTTRKLAVIT